MNSTISEKLKAIFPTKKTSFSTSVNPNICFDTQNANEKVFILTRAAFVTNFSWILEALVLLVISILFVYFVSTLNLNSLFLGLGSISPAIIFAICAFLIAVYIGFIYTNFAKWYYNLYIITNERILDYDYIPGGQFKISEANLIDIEDVTQTQQGFFPNIFNYGDIIIQTAAERMQFHFSRVSNPSYLRNKIVDLSELMKEAHSITP